MNSCISVLFKHFPFILRMVTLCVNSPNTVLSLFLMLCVCNTGNVEQIQDNVYYFLTLTHSS